MLPERKEDGDDDDWESPKFDDSCIDLDPANVFEIADNAVVRGNDSDIADEADEDSTAEAENAGVAAAAAAENGAKAALLGGVASIPDIGVAAINAETVLPSVPTIAVVELALLEAKPLPIPLYIQHRDNCWLKNATCCSSRRSSTPALVDSSLFVC